MDLVRIGFVWIPIGKALIFDLFDGDQIKNLAQWQK